MKKSVFIRFLSAVLAICALLGMTTALPLTASATDAASDAVTTDQNTFDFDANILLSAFWPPTSQYVNDEQYQLMADAGINWVMGAGDPSISNPAIQSQMLQLCEKYGMGMTVSDGTFGGSLLDKTPEQIAQSIRRYENFPAANGFYIMDEPYNPNGFVDAYTSLKKADPDGYMHLNFLPGQVYGSHERYYSQMYDWCARCAYEGYPVDYLIFDNYPFPMEGDMDRNGFMANLRTCHDVGLANGVKTGAYIQSVCIPGGFRTPSADELRYEMYLCLAFGYKQLSFFTWFTPVNRGEPFENGIISPEGVPNAHYDAIKTINHEILAIGSTLVKCEALEVYLNGQNWGQPSIPKDLFVQPADRKHYTLSFMKHQETGRNYIMVVNNLYTAEQTLSLKFDASVTSLSEVSRTDGSLVPLTMDGNKLTMTLAAGDGMLIALPEGLDFAKTPAVEVAPGTNLATLDGVTVNASSSLGEKGYYINTLIDGKRASDDTSKGWSPVIGEDAEAIINLGMTRDFNRVDLYPEGRFMDYGTSFPENFQIAVSSDGESYTTVANISSFTIEDKGVSVTFDTVNAQFVRISVEGRDTAIAIAEMEIYNDDGSVADVPTLLDMQSGNDAVDYTEGKNIALKRPVYTSSAATGESYEAWGWAPHFINDGYPRKGWTSNIGLNSSPDATEYVIIDFGDLFAVNSLEIIPNGYFPEDYTVALSVDGKTWTTVYEVTGSENLTETFDISLAEAVNARFVRFQATKLRGEEGNYLLQLGEIKAYGAPVCDKSELEAAMAEYLTVDGRSESDEAYANAVAGMADTTLTQSQANALIHALLNTEDTEIPEDETTAPAEDVTEASTEAETESSTEAETEAETETEEATDTTEETAAEDVTQTSTQAPAETAADETTPPETQGESSSADTTADQTGDAGCSSVISTCSTITFMAMAAAMALRKKKES